MPSTDHSAKATPTAGERLLIAAVRAAGFEAPIPEHRFHPDRKWRFDWAWLSYKVAFEREGGTETRRGKSRHTSRDGYRRDAVKYNEASLLGWLVVRATASMIADGTAAEQIVRALRERVANVDHD